MPLQKYLSCWNIDIIHTNSFTHTIGAELAQRNNSPHVWHIREALKEDYDLLFDHINSYRKLLQETEKVICISRYVKKAAS